VDLDKMRSKTTSSVATLGTIGVQVTVIAVIGSIFYWKLPVLPICTALALLAGWLFTISAENAARYTEAHSEEIAKLLIV
jgi:hypothetical protein